MSTSPRSGSNHDARNPARRRENPPRHPHPLHQRPAAQRHDLGDLPPNFRSLPRFRPSRRHLYTFCGTPTEAGYGLSPTAWTAPEPYDFSELDERALMMLLENPNAYFFPRLYLHAPKWWSEQHPDDIVLMDPGDGKSTPFIHSGGKPAPSWASEAWRRDTVEGLRRLIAHVEASPYADRVIGYHLASGTTEEWMMWGGNENQWVDYSPVNTGAFRGWLRASTAREAALQAGLARYRLRRLDHRHDPDQGAAPSSELGVAPRPGQGAGRHRLLPLQLRPVADTIGDFAKAVKELTSAREGRRGVLRLPAATLRRATPAERRAPGPARRCSASPDVDFLCSPTSYAFRQLGGEGTSHFMSLARQRPSCTASSGSTRTTSAPRWLPASGRRVGQAGGPRRRHPPAGQGTGQRASPTARPNGGSMWAATATTIRR